MKAPKYIKQILTEIKGENNQDSLTVEDFNTLLTSMDRSSRSKMHKVTDILNDTMEEIDLIDTFKILHPFKNTKYKYFSSASETFSSIHHIPGHKANCNEFKSIKLFQESSVTMVEWN